MEAIEVDPNYSVSHRALSRLIKYTDKDQHFLRLKDFSLPLTDGVA